MVSTFGTNSPNNDLYLGPDGNLVFLSGIDAVVASCTTACLGQLGEMILQTGLGLPNFQTIWVGVPDYALWQSYLENTLLNVPGVQSVDSIVLRASNNVLTYVAEITTIFGSTNISGDINQ